MATFVSFQEANEGATFGLGQVGVDNLANYVAQVFQQQGYLLEEGTLVNGIYGKGDKAGRFLLGGLAKRYKFRVQLAQTQETVTVTLSKGMTGWSGGWLGASAMKKEARYIIQVLNHAFTHLAQVTAPPGTGPAAEA